MTTYNIAAAADRIGVGEMPDLIGSGTQAIGFGNSGTVTINGTKIYKQVQGLKPFVIVQYTMENNDYTLTTATLEVFPAFERPGVDMSVDSLSADFVFGVMKFDLTRGIMGETSQDIMFPSDLQNKTSAEPAPSLHLTDDYTRVFVCPAIPFKNVPMAFRVVITAANTEGSGTRTLRAAAWVVGN